MTGHLTQVLNNVTEIINQSKTLTGLPPDAQEILNTAVSISRGIVTEVKGLQGTVLPFTEKATQQLNIALDIVTGTRPLDEVKSVLVDVHGEAVIVQGASTKASENVKESIAKLQGLPDKLAPIIKRLNDEKITLSTQLEAAKKEESATKDNYYYLLMLGPFGLVGLAAALALYSHWSGRVNELQAKESELTRSIANLTAMITSTQTLGTEIGNLSSVMLQVSNAVDIVTTGLQTIIEDVNQPNAQRGMIELRIRAALLQVKTLAVDVS